MFVVEVSIATIASVLQTLLVDCSEKTVHVFDDGLYFLFSLVYIISLIPFFFFFFFNSICVSSTTLSCIIQKLLSRAMLADSTKIYMGDFKDTFASSS